MALLACMAWPAGRSGATVTIDTWVLAGSGSAHIVLDDNHLVTQRWAGGACCTSLGYPTDHHMPWFCYLQRVDPGNGSGPALVWIGAAPGQNCWPGYDQSGQYGWTNGFGHYEGQAFSQGYAVRRPYGNGTVVELW